MDACAVENECQVSFLLYHSSPVHNTQNLLILKQIFCHIFHSYKEKASHISKAMRMRPRAPEKEAADVVEYVQALRNLDHLKPRGLNLPFYQLYMLDVIFVILLAVVLLLFALKALLGFVVKLCCRGGTKKPKMS